MQFKNGKYLGKEICAFSGDWLIVWDGKYNYMLFDSDNAVNIERLSNNRLPVNWSLRVNNDGTVHGGAKYVEFYSTFDNAIDNLVKVVANNSFLTRSRVIKDAI